MTNEQDKTMAGSTEQEERFPFDAILEMCDRLGVRDIGSMDGFWTYVIDDHWWIAVNGHKVDVEAQSPQHVNPTPVPPFTAYVEFNGWPAGLIDPYGGTLAAGEIANAETFMAACDAVVAGGAIGALTNTSEPPTTRENLKTRADRQQHDAL